MRTQTLLWTALPDGQERDVEGRWLRLSVLVSPRLWTDEGLPRPTLDQFPDFLGAATDWPERMRAASFTVRIGGQAFAGQLASAPDSLLWRALVSPKTFVRPHRFEDCSDRFVLSSPTLNLLHHLRERYGRLAVEAGDELPDADKQARELVHLTGLPEPERLLTQLRDQYREVGAVPLRRPALVDDFALLQLCLTPPSRRIQVTDPDPAKPLAERATWNSHERVALPAPEDFQDLIDAHQIFAALDEYPALQRRAGLVLDLRVRVPDDLAFASPVPVEVLAHWTPLGVNSADRSSRTFSRCTPAEFRPAPGPAGAELAGGLLDLGSGPYGLISLDVPGLAQKTLGFAHSLRQSRERRTLDTPARAGAPSPRTAGLQLVRSGRAVSLAAAFRGSASKNFRLEHGLPVELWAEDLVRGWRLDVWDDVSGRWRSLHERIGSYRLLATGETLSIADEGLLRLGATESADKATQPGATQLYLHEALAVWQGWSLSASRPGLGIAPDESVRELPDDAPPGLPLQAAFRARPGSLPRLRYGRSYRVRARVVDLAGNSLAPSTADLGLPGAALGPEPFVRFEPVPSPVFALVEPALPGPGESMERLAIRSFNDAPARDGDPTGDETLRHVLPPRTSQVEAERHGVLDAPGRPDPAAWAMLVEQDGDLGHVELLSGKYARGPVPLVLPYLPDPFARGAALRILDLPGWPEDRVLVVPFLPGPARWPDALPFRLRLLESAAQPDFDEVERVLSVPLPKGEQVRVRVSSLLGEDDLPQMGVWQWVLQRQPADLPRLERLALEGRHWMLTPWREIRLVHATQQPLGVPELQQLGTWKNEGDTFAQLHFVTPLHRKSTQKVDVFGEWNEPVDDPAEAAGPRNVERNGHACELAVLIEAPLGSLRVPDKDEPAPRHELGDTRYRRLTYVAQSTTRFRESMTGLLPLPEELEDFTRRSPPAVTWTPSSARPEPPRVLYVLPTFGWTRSTSGSAEARTTTRRRGGGGLRVYLDRPWFSSGYGEMLAVVVPSPLPFHAETLGSLAGSLTQWGKDPLWDSAPVAGSSPPIEAFPRAIFTADAAEAVAPSVVPAAERRPPVDLLPALGVSLAEKQGTYALALPHAVEYDPERGLWYCDIEIRSGRSYFPFVRLALARYQPGSLDGLHISRLVRADFAQLAPDRLLSVTRAASRARRVALWGHGYAGSAGSAELVTAPGGLLSELVFLGHGDVAPKSVIEMRVERLDESIGTDLGWRPVPAVITPDAPLAPWLREAVAGKLSFRDLARLSKRRVAAAAAEPALVFDDDMARRLPASMLQKIGIGTPLLWSGTVTLPGQDDGSTYRLVIEELEEYIGDAYRTRKRRRTVYADIIDW